MRAKTINENMGYKSFFGKKVSHKEALQKSIRDHITRIITDERGISEKAFSDYDNVMAEVKEVCTNIPEIYEKAEKFYQDKKRLNFLAEEIYEKYFKNNVDTRKFIQYPNG